MPIWGSALLWQARGRRVRDVVDELADAYEQTAEDVYRNHPFYEPPEQVATRRHTLRGLMPLRA